MEVVWRAFARHDKGLFFLILLMFFDLSHEVVWAALSRPLKPFALHAPNLPCVREGGFEAECSMQNAECRKDERVVSLIPLEFLICFQPLSHPRFARLTAPLGNGSQGCVLALNVSIKLFLILLGRK